MLPSIAMTDEAMPLACLSIGPPSSADARQHPRDHVHRSYRDVDYVVRCVNPGALTI